MRGFRHLDPFTRAFLQHHTYSSLSKLKSTWLTAYPTLPLYAMLLSQRPWISLTDILTKPANHSQKRIVPFSPEQYFDVVIDVNSYQKFLPWCQGSMVLAFAASQPGTFFAELTIGYKLFKERYRSIVTFERPHYIKVAAADSTVFSTLVNEWKFSPGPTLNTTQIEFQISFQFYNIVHQHTAGFFLNDLASSIALCFDERVSEIYGKAQPHHLIQIPITVASSKEEIETKCHDSGSKLTNGNAAGSNRDTLDLNINAPTHPHIQPVDHSLTPHDWSKFLLRLQQLSDDKLISPGEAKALRKMIRKANKEIAIVFLAYDPIYNQIAADSSEFSAKEALLLSNLQEILSDMIDDCLKIDVSDTGSVT